MHFFSIFRIVCKIFKVVHFGLKVGTRLFMIWNCIFVFVTYRGNWQCGMQCIKLCKYFKKIHITADHNSSTWFSLIHSIGTSSSYSSWNFSLSCDTTRESSDRHDSLDSRQILLRREGCVKIKSILPVQCASLQKNNNNFVFPFISVTRNVHIRPKNKWKWLKQKHSAELYVSLIWRYC